MSAVPSRSRLLVGALCAFFLLAFAPGALAATLTVDGSGNVVYAAAAGKINMVAFDETGTAEVQVTQAVALGDDDTITPSGNCTADVVGGVGEDNTFICTSVIGAVIATALDLDDTFDASGDYTGDGGLATIPAQFDGGDDADSLFGGAANDVIHGGNGNDEVFGDFGTPPGGDDQLFGEAGEDVVAGGQGNDLVEGGADDDDNVVGGPGTDNVLGGSGNDGFVAGGPGDDNVDGGDGSDAIFGDCAGSCPISAEGNDTLTGGAGEDFVQGDGGNDILHGNEDDDNLRGDRGNGVAGDDQLFGDAGEDDVRGQPGNDIADGGADRDFVAGGQGADSVNGGDGDDSVYGSTGDDNADGGAGDDYVTGDCGNYDECGDGPDGNDAVSGGSGQDFLDADGGADSMSGGTGIDEVEYPDRYECDFSPCGTISHPVSITLDGVANDGGAGEGDNVDVEDVHITDDDCCGGGVPEGGATIVGSAGVNALSGSDVNDTIDGGNGNDFLFGNGGDDTMNANDGFADRVVCGPGSDTANVDEFDQVADDCEVVNRTTRGHLATEDAPPTVAWTAPAPGAKLKSSANNLTVNATDDKGVSQVIFLAGERVVCTDTAAPFACAYNPNASDVGKDVMSAVAIDTSQQSASALRTFTVPRFKPRKVSAKTTPKKDSSAPFTFTTKGTVSRPTGVDAAAGCNGKVVVQFKAGKKTVSTRRATVKKNCSYRSKVTFTIPSRLHPSKLNVVATFRGNAVMTARKSKKSSVKV